MTDIVHGDSRLRTKKKLFYGGGVSGTQDMRVIDDVAKQVSDL